ncbi:MAG: prolyl-tRNA synthetase associated domain-containing protein [Lachnospiraceae bacterium]|nr:prolyl-tRNA synthetase associated domain-containing protein [Lachnospiraceae bacterium]
METFYIDRNFYTKRPDAKGRLEKEMKTYDLLEQLNIPFVRMDHDVTPTIEACEEIEKLLEISICKNLFLTNSAKTQFYLLMMPGRKKFRTADVSKQIGSSRLSFASETYMEEYLNLTPGSVTVLGLMNDHAHNVTLLIDRDLLSCEYIGCHPCINTSSLKLRTTDILTKFLPYTGHTPTIVDL